MSAPLKPEARRILFQTRERLGLSRQDLERATRDAGYKVSEGTIFNIETGVSKAPYARNIYALAAALSLDPNDLFETVEAAS